MPLGTPDLAIISGYLLFCLLIGVHFSKRAGANMEEFFLSGRNLPWWMLGTSMVATTFSADTPLAVTGLVAKEGVAGNWLWWNSAISGVFALLFLSRLWRRSGILTDLELISIRYSGKGMHILRGFRALWEGILINCIVMGWSTLAMGKILSVIFPISRVTAIGISLSIALFYSVLSGFWGVVTTDFIQFIIAMVGSIFLCIFSVREVGGISVLKERIFETFGQGSDILDIFPVSGDMLPLSSLAVFLTVAWWASKAADGGGYIAQRMLSARSERDSFTGYLWFLVAHYVLRPWPWIITALCSLVLLPGLSDPETGYPILVVRILPAGIKGLMMASFVAAYMSTIDTHLNFGASYVVNDFIKAYLVKEGRARRYVLISRGVVILLCAVTLAITLSLKSVSDTWKLLYSLTSGIGGVYIMRWLWWRVNAWSEISAWVSSALAFVIFKLSLPGMEFGTLLASVTLISTVTWITVTLLTPPVEREKLLSFFTRVRPPPPLWKGSTLPMPGRAGGISARRMLLQWMIATAALLSLLISIGKFLLAYPLEGAAFLSLSAISFFLFLQFSEGKNR